MRRLILARHAESELNLREVLNGDASAPGPLTKRGRRQARALGAAVGAVDLVAHTTFARTRETAELAWPEAPKVALPELDEIAYGRFEGTAWGAGYGEWVGTAGPLDECPGGGESRAAAARRFVSGFRRLGGATEETVAAVVHGVHVAYILLALQGRPPAPVLAGVPAAVGFVVAADRFAEAVDVLAAWVEEPSWA